MKARLSIVFISSLLSAIAPGSANAALGQQPAASKIFTIPTLPTGGLILVQLGGKERLDQKDRIQLKEKATEWGTITYISAGWVQDSMAIGHSMSPVTNPSGCSVETGGYATDPNDPGHNLFHTIALSAFMNKKQVSLVILGCSFDKPKVIGISVRP